MPVTSVDVIAPLVLSFAPTVVAVTSTETVQVPLTAIEPSEKFNVVSFAAGEKVSEPQSVVLSFGMLATFTSVGKLSVKETPVRARPALGLVMVKVSVLVPLTAIGSGLKTFSIVGGSGRVVSTSLLGVSGITLSDFILAVFVTLDRVTGVSTVTWKVRSGTTNTLFEVAKFQMLPASGSIVKVALPGEVTAVTTQVQVKVVVVPAVTGSAVGAELPEQSASPLAVGVPGEKLAISSVLSRDKVIVMLSPAFTIVGAALKLAFLVMPGSV